MSTVTPQFADGSFGPPVQGGRVRTGGPDWLRLGALSLVLVLVMCLGVGATAAGVIVYGANQIGTVDVPGLASTADDQPGAPAGSQPGDEVLAADDGEGDGEIGPVSDDGAEELDPGAVEELDIAEIDEVLNVLLVGSDSRGSLTDDQLLQMGTEREGDGVGLTDTIILVQLDPRRDGAVMLSFPRDLLVERCDGTNGKINAAYFIGDRDGVGGPACIVQTISTLTDIPIHHYMEVDLAGFVDVVDAIGGVSLYLDQPMRDRYAGLDLPSGCVTLDGMTGLSFVRARKIDSDFGRMARQQRFAKEVVAQAVSVDTLVNVPRLLSLVDAAAGSVQTDQGFDLRKMQRLAFSLRDLGAQGLDSRTVPGVGRTIDGVAYVVPDETRAEELFAGFRDGIIIPEGGAQAPLPTLDVDSVGPIVILNGAGIAGLSRDVRLQLTEEGFQVSETGNLSGFGVTETYLEHTPERRAEAGVLAQALGDIPIEESEEEQTGDLGEAGAGGLTLVLGEDHDPDQALALGAPEDGATAAGDDADPDPEPDGDELDDLGDGETDDDELGDGVEVGETVAPEPEFSRFTGATQFDVDCG